MSNTNLVIFISILAKIEMKVLKIIIRDINLNFLFIFNLYLVVYDIFYKLKVH